MTLYWSESKSLLLFSILGFLSCRSDLHPVLRGRGRRPRHVIRGSVLSTPLPRGSQTAHWNRDRRKEIPQGNCKHCVCVFAPAKHAWYQGRYRRTVSFNYVTVRAKQSHEHDQPTDRGHEFHAPVFSGQRRPGSAASHWGQPFAHAVRKWTC